MQQESHLRLRKSTFTLVSMDWNDLRYVLEIARGGSLSAAARLLHVNISSVYRRLEALEGRMGVRLFERRRDRYRLTAAGQALADAGGRMESEALDADRRVRGTDNRIEGPLRLSTGEAVALHLLPRYLDDFSAMYPGISLEVGVTDEVIDLSRRDVDVVIRDSARAPEHLVGRKAARLAIAAYATPSLLDRLGRRLPLGEYPWLAFDGGLSRLAEALRFAEHAASAKRRLTFDSLGALRAAVCAGLGVGLFPCFMCDEDPRLERLPGTLVETSVYLWVLTHPDLRRSARVRVFLEYFGTRLAAESSRLLGKVGTRPKSRIAVPA